MAMASPWGDLASPVQIAPPAAKNNQGPNPDEGFWHYQGRAMLDDLEGQARGVGLGARYATEGAMAIPSIVANIPAFVANNTRWAADKAMGIPEGSPPIKYVNPSEMVPSLPEPANAKERIAGDIIRPLASVGATAQMGANAIKNGSQFIGPKLAKLMADRPAIQAQAAVGSGAMAGAAREAGGGPLTEGLAGVAGGFAAPAGVGAFKGAMGLAQPFMESGRSQIADNILASHADAPAQAATALQNVQEYVPGSKPTGGTASGDLGLIGVEKTLMQNPANYFGERLGDQNTARTNFINQVAGDETTIPRYSEMRSNATGPMYEQASQQPIDPKGMAGVMGNIGQRIMQVGPNSDAGATLTALQRDIQQTLPKQNLGNQYFTPNTPVPPPVPQSQLIQLYRENRDALNKTGMQPGAYGSTVKGVIKPLNQQLGAALEAQNPLLAQANELHAQMSVPIDQTTNMQTLVPRMTGGVEDLQGNNIFSPSKVGNIVKQGEMPTAYNGVQPLNKALSPEQHQALMALNQDMQRSNAVNIPMVRPPGSNTFNNAASTAELANSLAGKVAQHVPFFGKAYTAQNEKIMQAMAEKMLDTKATREALLAGKPLDRDLLQGLLRASKAATIGTGTGFVTTGGRQ